MSMDLLLLLSRLKHDGVDDVRQQVGNIFRQVLLVQLVHEHDDDGQLGEHLQRVS